jgi:hypothetical protein
VCHDFRSINGHGRTEIFRRVSRASRQSFRVPDLNVGAPLPSTTTAASVAAPTPKVVRRKASFEGVVKHLADLAVTISGDDGAGKKVSAGSDVFNGRARDDEFAIQVKQAINSAQCIGIYHIAKFTIFQFSSFAQPQSKCLLLLYFNFQ